MQYFKINEYIEMRLENNNTIIYIAGKRFDQCKSLILKIPIDQITSLNKIESIEEAAKQLDESTIENNQIMQIPPETEFWGHCSNLQVWFEYKYDTKLLHSNLAFPLLKRLTEAGDPLAKKVFKEEITKRLESGNITVANFLMDENLFKEFTTEEMEYLLLNTNLIKSIITKLKKEKYYIEDFAYGFCQHFQRKVPKALEKALLNFIKSCSASELFTFFNYSFEEYIETQNFVKILLIERLNLIEKLKKVKKIDNFILYYINWKPITNVNLRAFENSILELLNNNDIELFEILFAIRVLDYLDVQFFRSNENFFLNKIKKLYEIISSFSKNESDDITVRIINLLFKEGQDIITKFFRELSEELKELFLENLKRFRDSRLKPRKIIALKILNLVKQKNN
ncbi:MAG: hypothetical protein ACTSR8_00950 [Promethearchaeota archaeon]